MSHQGFVPSHEELVAHRRSLPPPIYVRMVEIIMEQVRSSWERLRR